MDAHPDRLVIQSPNLLKFTSYRGLVVSFYLPAFLLFVLWLWPFAYGPIASVWPDLFAWAIGLCLCVLFVAAPQNMAFAIAAGCLCAAIASSFLGIIQYFDMGEWLWPLLVRAELGKAYANLRQVNHLASLLAVGFWALLWLIPSWSPSKTVLYLGGLVLAVGMAATASRTGALQFLWVGFLAFFWRKPGEKKAVYFSVFVILAFLVAAATLPWLLEYSTGYEARVLFDRLWMNQGCSSRAVLWGNVLHLISLKPVTGWGWGELAYAHYVTLYDELRFCGKLGNAHNLFLHAAVVLGIPVAAALALALGSAVYFFKPWRETHPDSRLAWGVLGLLFIHSMLEYPLWFGNFQVLWVVCVAVLWLARQGQLTQPIAPRIRQARWVNGVVFAMLLVMTWMGWDYLRVTQLYLPAKDRLARFEYDTLNKVRHSVFFSNEVLFAQVNNSQPAPANAKAILSGALVAIHAYPEPRMAEKLIAAALLSDDTELAKYHAVRFKATWPQEFSYFLAAHPGAENRMNLAP